MKRLILMVVAGLFLLSASSVLAQGMPCIADLNCDHNVDANDVVMFLGQFGRNPFFEPCPDCYDSPCPCSSTVPKTGQTTSYATGDDGDLEKGLIWPNPRFTDNGDGTVTDNLTNLVWLKEANCISLNYPSYDNDDIVGDGRVNWQHALDFVAGINDGTYPDCGAGSTKWRLPNSNEVANLVHKGYYSPAMPNTAGTGQWSEGDPFTNVQTLYYWSSTTNAFNTDYAWRVYMALGDVNSDLKSHDNYVWPVRDGH